MGLARTPDPIPSGYFQPAWPWPVPYFSPTRALMKWITLGPWEGVHAHHTGCWQKAITSLMFIQRSSEARSVSEATGFSNAGEPSVSVQWSCKCASYPSPQVHNLQELRRSASLATKVFIQRDYSDGTICQFQTKFPPELDSRIERQLFEETVKTLNGFYAEAEKIGGSSYLEGCLACATAYFIFLCTETHYEKVLKKISRYIQEQNEKVFAPRGLLLTDPVERGMRVIEIAIYEDRCSSGSSSSGSSSGSGSGSSSAGGGGAGAR
ncbi:Golgin subfamily A member 7/ERF4 containing protein [Cricetulus griseus]|nr:Golgin subfamily A member 7/ERF4 containing protein [Cricetulus griseus]